MGRQRALTPPDSVALSGRLPCRDSGGIERLNRDLGLDLLGLYRRQLSGIRREQDAPIPTEAVLGDDPDLGFRAHVVGRLGHGHEDCPHGPEQAERPLDALAQGSSARLLGDVLHRVTTTPGGAVDDPSDRHVLC